MRAFLAAVSTPLVVTCTIFTCLVVIRREMFPSPVLAVGNAPPVKVDDWESVARYGHRLGPDPAELTVVVFSDFECPACARFALVTYPHLRELYGDRIALVYRHWPLPQHRNAYAAARASECAASQGAFEAYHSVLFNGQNRLGQVSFEQMAGEAGIDDMSLFATCIRDSLPDAAVERDTQAALAVGATGTPAIVINGWYLPGGYSTDMLDSVVVGLVAPPQRSKSR